MKRGRTKKAATRGMSAETTTPIFNKAEWATLKEYERLFGGFAPTTKTDGVGTAILACLGLLGAGESLNAVQIAARINQERRNVTQRIGRMVRHGLVRKTSGNLYALTNEGAQIWEVLPEDMR